MQREASVLSKGKIARHQKLALQSCLLPATGIATHLSGAGNDDMNKGGLF
jgi:hypothetical protein